MSRGLQGEKRKTGDKQPREQSLYIWLWDREERGKWEVGSSQTRWASQGVRGKGTKQ
jgi:hypothetical protein